MSSTGDEEETARRRGKETPETGRKGGEKISRRLWWRFLCLEAGIISNLLCLQIDFHFPIVQLGLSLCVHFVPYHLMAQLEALDCLSVLSGSV